jgi:hypothetical protein
MNPGGSVKDRPARWMILDAERRGTLVRGQAGRIVEGKRYTVFALFCPLRIIILTVPGSHGRKHGHRTGFNGGRAWLRFGLYVAEQH